MSPTHSAQEKAAVARLNVVNDKITGCIALRDGPDDECLFTDSSIILTAYCSHILQLLRYEGPQKAVSPSLLIFQTSISSFLPKENANHRSLDPSLKTLQMIEPNALYVEHEMSWNLKTTTRK